MLNNELTLQPQLSQFLRLTLNKCHKLYGLNTVSMKCNRILKDILDTFGHCSYNYFIISHLYLTVDTYFNFHKLLPVISFIDIKQQLFFLEKGVDYKLNLSCLKNRSIFKYYFYTLRFILHFQLFSTFANSHILISYLLNP